MNLVFDLLMKSRFVAFDAYGVSLAGTIVAEAIAAYHAWRVLKICQEGQSALDLELDGGGTNYIQAEEGSARAPVLNQGAAPGAGAGRNGRTNFAMFSGPGHRLIE